MSCQHFQHCEHGANTFTVMMPKLTFGRGCLSEAGARASTWNMKRAALFVDPTLVSGAYADTVMQSLRESSIEFDVFSEIRIEPDDKTVMSAAKFMHEGKFDGVVSLGGGSTIDTAKAAMAYSFGKAEFLDYFAPPVGAGKPIPGPLQPHLACPTTSGTGSECTSVTVLRINELNCKFVIGSPYMLPSEALVDPVCTETLPANIVASTGFDLLCHALECYTARAYTLWDKIEDPAKRPLLQGANPWSDMAATKAMTIVGKYLERGVADAKDSEARDNLMWGATLAGMAFGNSGTHLPHAMSYGVTHLMDDITTEGYSVPSPFVPHGFSVVVNAPAILRYMADAAPVRHLEAAAYLGADLNGAANDDAGEVISKRIIELMKDTSAPNGLTGVGFGLDDVKAMANSSIRQTRAIANAPKVANLSDLESIYTDAISYW